MYPKWTTLVMYPTPNNRTLMCNLRTPLHGSSGVRSVPSTDGHGGFNAMTSTNNPYNSLCLLLANGSKVPQRRLSVLKPYGISSAMCDGVINLSSASDLSSSHSTSSSSTACDDSALQANSETPCPSTCSSVSPTDSASAHPTTASFVGLRCWASSFACEGPSFSRPTDGVTATVSE
jgi:hypothetical protein